MYIFFHFGNHFYGWLSPQTSLNTTRKISRQTFHQEIRYKLRDKRNVKCQIAVGPPKVITQNNVVLICGDPWMLTMPGKV